MDHLNDSELQVGDVVYYLAPSSTYSIRKSVIKEKKVIPVNHHTRPFGGCKLTLADGAVLEYFDVFDLKEKVLEYIVADLELSIAGKRRALQTIQNKIETCERLLKVYKQQLNSAQ